MKITVCIGSSCHLKGSKLVVEQLQQFIEEKNLADKIVLTGTFCMGNCQSGVNVTIDKERFSVSSGTVKTFFEEQVLNRLNNS